MLQQGWPSKALEVGDLPHDVEQVGGVGEGGGEILAQAGPGVGRQHAGQEEGTQKQQPQRGPQAARPAQPKASQPQAAIGAVVHQQQGSDQIAREHEEGLDAQEAARGPGEPHMIQEDRAHGNSPQAIQTGHIR